MVAVGGLVVVVTWRWAVVADGDLCSFRVVVVVVDDDWVGLL